VCAGADAALYVLSAIDVCTYVYAYRVLQGIRERSVAAKKGYDLLKRKSDAIKLSLNSKLKEILTVTTS
jgi:hypothetical protein